MFESDKNFYSLLPDGYHATGDIWMRLPSFGLVPNDQVTGLVVTPACDLANCKTETVTYVPVVPITQFLMMPEFRAEIARQATESLNALGVHSDLGVSPNFDFATEQITRELKSLQIDKTKQPLRLRCLKAIEFLNRARAGPIPELELKNMISEALGKSWEKAKARIVRNSYRNDIYYLPPDRQNPQWSAIPNHSIALLRYLLTVPTFFLDQAHHADEHDWHKRREQLLRRNLHWCRYCHEELPPIRTLRLRETFLSDLLTKLIGLYVRLGAPDLDPAILKRIEREL